MTIDEFVDKWGDMEEWREGRNDHAMRADLTALLAEREQTVREDAARMIEVLYLPAYSQENAAIDGVLISRREAETDLKAIVAAIRAKEKA